MKKILIAGLLLSSTLVHSKSYFVKLKSHESLRSLTLTKSFSNEILSLRTVPSEIAPYAVIESTLSKDDLKEELQKNAFPVAYVEPNEINYKMSETYQPIDSKYSSQWGLTGKYGVGGEQAWTTQKGSKDVIVAVIDSGIDYKHPDLMRNLWTNDAELNGTEGVDDDGNGVVDDIYGINAFANTGDPMDDNGHGSHCAGVIGADHNSQGVAGVMANVRMMGVKIFSKNGRTTVEAIVRGIEYAIENKVHVMSNSWGGTESSEGIADAIKAAGEAGIIFVAAAGNGNFIGLGYDIDRNNIYPAGHDFDHIVSVGSIKKSGRKSTFSNYGKVGVDLFAPGSSIYSTYKNQGYKSLSGTSMATPHVSGVAGLVVAQYPGADALEIKSRIMDGVKKVSRLSGKSVSGGILSAPGALGL
jgi:subtilisin family serine protease